MVMNEKIESLNLFIFTANDSARNTKFGNVFVM